MDEAKVLVPRDGTGLRAERATAAARKTVVKPENPTTIENTVAMLIVRAPGVPFSILRTHPKLAPYLDGKPKVAERGGFEPPLPFE
ncbi:MAG TPA: hypothetical protein VK633_14505 [Verrucomicrobiae bacterium]|nr:hypothetical protein [Verrucomicrobiae bacterium]